MGKMDSGKEHCNNGHSHFFLSRPLAFFFNLCEKFVALGKHLTFLENYPAKLEFLGSIKIAGWVNFFCISGDA